MKYIQKICAVALLAISLCVIMPSYDEAHAQIPSSEDLFNRDKDNDRKSDFFKDTPLVDYTGTTRELDDNGIAEAGQYQFRFLVERVVNFIKQIMIPIAVVLLAAGGMALIFAGGDQDAVEQRKNQIIGTAMGFGLFVMAVTLVDSVFFGQQGEIFRFGVTSEQYAAIDACRDQGINLDRCAAYTDYTKEFGNRFGAEMLALFNFLSSYMVGVAVLFLVVGGFRVMTAGGEDAVTLAKQRVIHSSAGIFIVVLFQQLYRILVNNGQVRVPYGRDIIELAGGWLNFAMGTIGFLCVIGIVYGGIRLLTSFGNEESQTVAKNIVIGSVIGIIITLSAYTVIGFLGGAL